jgi:N-acetylglucosamine-6-phosphate deacetylase
MESAFYHGCALLLEGAWRTGMGVLCQAGRIAAILPDTATPPAPRVALPPEALLAPGFVDVQVNGGGGVLFNDDPTARAARHIAAAHRHLGTTSIMPTLITSTRATMHGTEPVSGPGVLGIHFEGPFLSPQRPGVHRCDYIRAPDEADVVFLQGVAGRCPVLLTVAPECVPHAVMARLAASSVVIAAGHSAAAFEDVRPPVRGITHIFNAMPPAGARAPGLVAAGLLGDVFAGVIMDGIHVHPAMLRLLLAAKPVERVMLVSDSMSVAGTGATEFMLQGRRIVRRDGRLTTEDGTLAGADLSMAQAVRNAVSMLALSPAQAIAMATEVPANFMRVQHDLGRIAVGLRADFVLLSPALEVLGTVLAGAFQAVPGALAA